MRVALVKMAVVLSLGATTAIAGPGPFRHQTSTTATDVRAGANEPSASSGPTASDEPAISGEEQQQQAVPETQAAEPADSDAEPESISGGSEP